MMEVVVLGAIVWVCSVAVAYADDYWSVAATERRKQAAKQAKQAAQG